MRYPTLCSWLVSALFLVGCSGIRVNQDYEPGTDFSKLKSFEWKSAEQPKTGDLRSDNPLLDARVRKAVEEQLAADGIQKTDGGSVDFLVSYSLAVRTGYDSSRVGVGVGTGFGIGSGGTFGGIGVGAPVGSPSEEGMLVIDFTDPKTGDLIWRGTGSGRLSFQKAPEQTTEEVRALVEKVLAQFPPAS